MLGIALNLWVKLHNAVSAVVPGTGFELREDGSFELREDGSFELRE